MRVALVTTPPSVRSGIGDYTRHLLPYLREHVEVQVFVRHGCDDPLWRGERARLVDELRPGEFDQILYQLGNEQSHGFMPRMVRALGGTVAQHDWVLFDMATAAWPGLVRGGAKGHALALREGGLAQAHAYLRNWLERRRARTRPLAPSDLSALEGTLLAGWHALEGRGRWTADFASLRIPSESVESVRFELHGPGKPVRIHEGACVLAEGREASFEVRPANARFPVLVLETEGITVTREQRQKGDARRMGSFVTRVSYRDSSGLHELDLAQPSALPADPVTLSRDRFLLPLNRSVVRHADAFIVHSRFVAERIARERNAPTPLGLVQHGAEIRWRDGDRIEARRALGLAEDWQRSFLVVSFGGVQPHKRVDRALEALALARAQRPDIRLVLAGTLHAQEFDPLAMAARLGLRETVHATGHLPEERAWDWLHAGDFALNLRGPTTGGTSGGIFQSFSMGRPVIATDAAEQKELPDSCVVRIPLGEGEVETLARELVSLRDDPARRARLEQGVREFVRRECHWGVVARQYAQHLESFPRARASPRKLIALRSYLQRSAL